MIGCKEIISFESWFDVREWVQSDMKSQKKSDFFQVQKIFRFHIATPKPAQEEEYHTKSTPWPFFLLKKSIPCLTTLQSFVKSKLQKKTNIEVLF